MKTINAKSLRSRMAEILGRVRKGEKFTVLYRSRPVCQLVPLAGEVAQERGLEEDPLYGAEAIGRSKGKRTSADHDRDLYR